MGNIGKFGFPPLFMHMEGEYVIFFLGLMESDGSSWSNICKIRKNLGCFHPIQEISSEKRWIFFLNVVGNETPRP